MNYAKQEQYLRSSRLAALALSVLLVALAGACLNFARPGKTGIQVVFALLIAAIVISLCYTPDYLHLTVKLDKAARWETKIRWRLVALVLILGFGFSSSVRDVLGTVAIAAWLAAANFLALRLLDHNYFPIYFWFTDLALLAFILLPHGRGPLLATGLLALAAHLSIVINEERPWLWASVVTVSGWLLMLPLWIRTRTPWLIWLLEAALLAAAAIGTAWLFRLAYRQSTFNLWAAMGELVGFKNCPVGQVWLAWRTSDQQLAQNWVRAAPDENDSRALAEWYRQNSELYMFAISAYNLDYKRICSNLKVLRHARGACLDYGAGNGEIVLELARRGHPSAYYDVEGESAKFAQYRAQRQNLDVKFHFSRESLGAAGGFDTIFSLDVLEHIPDLAAELDFLASLLNPGGLLLFDVPAGATRSHPMHLSHNVDFRSLLKAKGLREQRPWWTRLPLVKQEKFLFVKGR